MEEIEVKVLEVAADDLVARLVALGARQDVDMDMEALYFDTPERTLSARKDSLRLRREGGRVVLNYKMHRVGRDRDQGVMKVRDEHETAVESLETARRILEGLGYEVWFESRKHRRGYVLDRLPGVHFVLDRLGGAHAHVPEFLEIEAPTPDLLGEAVMTAGYTMDQTVPWNGFEVVQHYALPGR